jgi:hypothetical protein
MSAADNSNPCKKNYKGDNQIQHHHTGGHPSIIAPTEAQWLSPYVVTLKRVPYVDIVNLGSTKAKRQKTG